MSMYNLIKYSDNYSNTSGRFWHYYRDEPFLNADGILVIFLLMITVLRLNLKQK